MHHKLQNFPPKNDVQNSVVRNDNSTSPAEIASHDAGLASAGQAKPYAGQPLVVGLRCEVARSNGYDPTGENAVPCGAPAQVLCEYCGPMCSSCAEETFCFYGEHRYVDVQEPSAAESANSEALSEPSQPLFEVIYLELRCAQCDTVRLALPRSHTPDADWSIVCPICSRQTTWRYLAHGLTQRELPFYECFDPDAVQHGRIPWDLLAPLLEEDDE